MMSKPFVILAAARTGSNLLVRSLDRPPVIRCFGEVAKPTYPQDTWAIDALSKASKRAPEELIEMHESKLADLVFNVLYELPGARRSGFKFFYEHREYPAAEEVWQRLANDRTISVIHLVRLNLLELFLSLVYARQTDEWVRPARGEAKQPGNDQTNVVVSSLECQNFFEEYVRDQEAAKADFASHPYLEITYEDLARDPHEIVNHVRRFLGLNELPDYAPPLSKQAKRTPAEKIANFPELAGHFASSQWAHLFN